MSCLVALAVVFAGQSLVAAAVNKGPPGPAPPSCIGGAGRTPQALSSSMHKECGNFPSPVAGSGGRLNSRLRRFLRRPLPPAPPPPIMAPLFFGADKIFVTLVVLVFAVLLSLTLGWLPPIRVSHQYMWLVYPCTQLYLHMAQAGLGPLVGAIASPPPEATLYSKQMFALFACLLLQALTICSFCVAGPKPQLLPVLHPPMCIYLIAFTFYSYKSYGTPLVVPVDWTGISFHPLHLVMWTQSTSVQCMLWQQIYHRQCVSMGSFPFPAKEILFGQAMLWAGLLGHLDYGNPALNYALNAACFVLLYLLLAHCTRPLRLAAQHYHRLRTTDIPARTAPDSTPDPDREHHDDALRRLEAHFRLAHGYVWFSWHGFPLAWLLGVVGVIDGDTREGLYAVCDVFAKFLPVSIYLSMLDVRY